MLEVRNEVNKDNRWNNILQMDYLSMNLLRGFVESTLFDDDFEILNH